QDGLTPRQQLQRIDALAAELVAEQEVRWEALKTELGGAGIVLVEPQELTGAQLDWLVTYFLDQVFPVRTPLSTDPAHPFPFIPHLWFTIALRLRRESDGKSINALLPLPRPLDRFIRLPAGRPRKGGAQIR